jgi:PIN domain
MRSLRVLLDAGVLVDAQVRDVFLGLAEAGLVEFRWSDGVLDEVRSVLVDEMGRSEADATQLCDAIRGAFPLGEVVSSDEALAARLAGDDPEGLHPLVAAVTAEADLLVSHERRRFPPDQVLARWDLAVVSPEDALAEMVDLLGAEAVAEVFEGLSGTLGLTTDDLLVRLRRLGQVAPVAAVAIGAALDAAGADDLSGYLLEARPEEAQAAVAQLISRVGDGDLAGMDALLTEAGRMALGPTSRLRHGRLQDVLFDVLVNPGAWSFAGEGGNRPARVARSERSGGEVVRLVRTAEGPDAGAGPGGGLPAVRTSRDTGGNDGHALAAAVADLERAGTVAADARRGPLVRRSPSISFAVALVEGGWQIDGLEVDSPAGP